MCRLTAFRIALFVVALSIFASAPLPCFAELLFDSERLIQASGSNIVVPGYSVPSFVLWNADTLKDLVVGEGGGTSVQGKVRIYLNSGTASEPQFTNYFYVQAQGTDLVVSAGG
jgi:hypothetical protein